MRKTPRVSIVLPVYNGVRYLRQAIESILAQSFKDYELIIVDDCSSDNTYEIAIGFSKLNSCIRVLKNNTNKGLPASLNTGFSVAVGEYLTWTSDDNIYHETAIEKMVDALDSVPDCGLVYTEMNLIDESGALIGQRNGEDGNLYKNNCVGACFMYRDACRKMIGDYDENRFYVEDYDYWLRIAEQFRIIKISEILYDYRYHSNSLTVQKLRRVGEQLAKLRLDHIEKIISEVDTESLRAIVFEMLVCGADEVLEYVSDKIKSQVQFVFNRNKKINKDTIWIFGAGALGRSAVTILTDKKIEGFVDNNKIKIGCYLDNKKIISVDEYCRYHQESDIVIAVDLRYAYSISKQLIEQGIDNAVLLYDLC